MRSLVVGVVIVLTQMPASPACSEDPSAPAAAFDKPKCKVKSGRSLYYPVPARRLDQQGRVYIAYTIDKSGNVENAKVIASEPGDTFIWTALSSLHILTCDVPKNWVKIHGPDHVFRVNVIFQIEGEGGIQPYDANDEVSMITASNALTHDGH